MVGGRQSMVEDDLWWKTTFGGRRPSVEDDPQWMMTFGRRQPLMEDNPWWKTTFSGTRPLWILACCLLRFAAFFIYWTTMDKLEFTDWSQVNRILSRVTSESVPFQESENFHFSSLGSEICFVSRTKSFEARGLIVIGVPRMVNNN